MNANYDRLGAGAGMPAKAQESLLTNLNGSMEAELADLASSARRLHMVADRVLGSRPEAVDKGDGQSTSICSIQMLERNVSDLRRLRTSLSDAAERLERL